MPAPGEQHHSIANPFQETRPRISEFTAIEIATLQSRLEKQLGPEYLSSRSGPSGQKVHYITAEKCIALANNVFGFNGWSSSIQNIQVDFVDENPQTLKISLGLSVVVRVTLRDGTYHEDIGYGHIENCKGKAAAFEKAKKEGTTDGLKRTLRNFGNVLGNCIYDKDYLAKVTKLKAVPTKFDEANLHRHSDFVRRDSEPPKGGSVSASPPIFAPTAAPALGPPAQAAASPVPAPGPCSLTASVLASIDSLDNDFGDFDMADFGVIEEGHPDEVVVTTTHGINAPNNRVQPVSHGAHGRDSNRHPSVTAAPAPPAPRPQPQAQQPQQRIMSRVGSNGQIPPRPHPHTPHPPQTRPNGPHAARPVPYGQQQQPGRPPNQPPPGQSTYQVTAAQKSTMNTNSRTNTPPPGNAEPAGGVGFFSARSVKPLPEDAPPGSAVIAPNNAKRFDPHAESPSIRKTPGIDHRTSKPVGRNGQHVPPAKSRDDDVSVAPMAAPNPGPRPGPMNPPRPSVMNPAVTGMRQIGVPGGGHSPLGNRGAFRPPSIKRPADGGVGRPPLNEVSTNEPIAGGPGAEAKRQRTE